jgi:hypothetical protein
LLIEELESSERVF